MPVRVLFLLLLLPWSVSVEAADEYEKQLAFYKMNVDRPPLVHRLRGMERLAATRDPRALRVLAKRYAKPRVPKVQERYLLTVVLGKHFTEGRHAEALWDLLEKYKKDEHAWLWRNASAGLAAGPGVARVEAFVREPRAKPLLVAAALEGLATRAHPAGLKLVEGVLAGELPKEGPGRIVVLEACVSVLLAQADARTDDSLKRDDGFKQAASRVVDLLARDDVAERTKLVIARYLMRIYHADKLTTSHEYWRRMLGYKAAAGHEGGTVVGRPRFYGVEAAGSRVGYVLDMSDSMLQPLTKRERKDARFQEAQGGGDRGDDSIAWDEIRTRFDLARAYLKQSVSALNKDTSFVVVTFGDRARTLKVTKGLVPASRGNVKRVLKELDGIKPGSVTHKRPFGTLLGDTNLHTALLRVFRAIPRKFLDEEEDVDPAGLTKGCDTIFLFGDGKPTRDDFDATDRFDGGTITTDRETGETAKRAAGGANYFGPYVRKRHLLDDVMRMNLFRKAEIHTVSIGEADNGLMRGLADIGQGRHRSIGMLGRDGHINAWWVMGPFPAPDVASWEKAEAPEKGVHVKEQVVIGARRVRWRRVHTNHRKAIVDLNPHFKPNDHVAAYAFAEVHVEAPASARLKLGSDDGVRVWVNEKLVFSHLKKRGHKPDQDSIDIALVEGMNRILVKVCEDKGTWKLSARLTDESDRPLDFLMP